MTPKEALEYLTRYAPCAHEDADTSCGNGKIWAKCDNCDAIFLQENWDNIRSAATQYWKAIDRLQILIEKGK
jgi:hypothetical protein